MKITIKYPATGTVTGPLLRGNNSAFTKYQPTTAAAITEGDWAGYVELTATATETTDGLLITLNGSDFGTEEDYVYIAEIAVGEQTVALDTVGNITSGTGASTSVAVVDAPAN